MDFNFDECAMIQPKTPGDISALLAEALAELRSVNEALRLLLE